MVGAYPTCVVIVQQTLLVVPNAGVSTQETGLVEGWKVPPVFAKTPRFSTLSGTAHDQAC